MIQIPSRYAGPALSYVLFFLGIASVVCVLLSVGMILRGVIRKKDWTGWLIAFVIAALLAFCILTGRLITAV